MSQKPTEPSPSSEGPSGAPPRRTPPWLPLVAKWTIVCALFGFVMGVALGAFTGTIMPEESAELEDLQGQMLAYRRKVAPLPLEDVRRLHQELLSKAKTARKR